MFKDYTKILNKSTEALLRNADLTDSTMLVEASIALGPESGLERSTRGVLIHLGCLPEVPQV